MPVQSHSLLLERDRKRVREDRKLGVVVRETTFWGWARNYICGFERSQAVPACPSGRDNAYDRNSFLYDAGRAALY